MTLFEPVPEIALRQVSDQEELTRLVEIRLLPMVPERANLISVDGVDGSGKSSIAGAISFLSGRRLVALDEFLEKNQGQFIAALRTADLQRELACDTPVVVEGCLVQAVLQKLNFRSDFRIYIARTARMAADPQHEWCDDYELLLGSKSAEDLIREEEIGLKSFCHIQFFGSNSGDDGLPELCKELIRYHRAFQPQRKADLIVKVERQV